MRWNQKTKGIIYITWHVDLFKNAFNIFVYMVLNEYNKENFKQSFQERKEKLSS